MGDDEHRHRRQQRRAAQPDIQHQQQDAGADDEEGVAQELHQRLGEELVELVGVVVDARDQVARPVLVEEGDRQFLQLVEDGIAQVEQDTAGHPAHGAGLGIGRDEADGVDRQQQAAPQQHAVQISGGDEAVDGVPDDQRRGERGGRRDQDRRQRNGDVPAFALDQR